ncbi:WW domain-containing oxidoreductase-like [Ptychodera flava]|uniref:WW domain-containing oxidoreductase-like n=1 Tax=Ptychodera flava TaxID=63121 RepID=UPI00396A70DA
MSVQEASGKVCIITGSNTGIGFQAAKKMASMGYDVIIACRSEERGKAAEKKIKENIESAKVEFMQLDLASTASIYKFVDNFHATGKPLHVLCNNAGVVPGTGTECRQETEDGFEMAFGVNHLGHFLLTNLLLNDLKKAAEETGEARIVVTTSSMHDADYYLAAASAANLDFENLMLSKEGTFGGSLAYNNSKLANVLFTYELARRLEGSGVTCNCFHPGFIPDTEIFRNVGWIYKVLIVYLRPLYNLLGIATSSESAGDSMVFLSTDESMKGTTSKYFNGIKEATSSKVSYDMETAAKLWKISEELLHLGDK